MTEIYVIANAILLPLYLLALLFIFLYSLGQLDLLVKYLRNPRGATATSDEKRGELPFVTLQLPIYNELYVAERLLDSVAELDYPWDRFEIQVLDDSTDETKDMIARRVTLLRERGVPIEHVRRPDRIGFKAGALAYGMTLARGEYIAILDADFLPRPDFIENLLAHFTHDRIGVVQARWEHINRSYSPLTEVQAFHLDAHFTIEQRGRNSADYFINFNGTAGMWRRACIEDAGGWHHDTLTEDLDLSYRAQLRGWKFLYLEAEGVPAELPAEMGAIKSQQYRWMKGGAEVARKVLPQVWRSDQPLSRRLHGTLHLLSSSIFVVVFVLGLLNVPIVYLKQMYEPPLLHLMMLPAILFPFSFTVLSVYYLTAMIRLARGPGQGILRWLAYYIPFLSLSMGLSLHNARAVWQGYRGKWTPFVRTPKFNLVRRGDSWAGHKYKSRRVPAMSWVECFLALYFFAGCLLALSYDERVMGFFLLLQSLGFAVVGGLSIRHALVRKRGSAGPVARVSASERGVLTS